MFLFGHMGIGSKLVSPWSKGLSKPAVLIGTILPDLLDKPVYYGLAFATGKRGAELGIIASGRTFGHTAIFLIFVATASLFRRSRLLAALTLGMATHLFLDNLSDALAPRPQASAIVAMLWPLLGWQFPVIPYRDIEGHLGSVFVPIILGGEIVGLALLSWDAWKAAHEKEILTAIRERRIRFKRLRSLRRKRTYPPA